jgi:hypothetical protein
LAIDTWQSISEFIILEKNTANMKKIILSTLILSTAFLKISAQCLTVSCPGSTSVNNDAGSCGAVVNYTLPSMTTTCTAPATTFNYTGAVQSYTVPAGITSVTIEAWGAQGGANWVNNVNYGGYSKADFAVTPGEILTVYVGGHPNGITGGYNGGGNGEGAGQGGGGGSDVRQGGTTLNDRIIVGGGGGGAGYWSALHVVGGVGGGMTGGNGYRDPDFASNPGGLGGGQTSAGANGTCVSLNNPACAGSFGQGGAPSGCGCEGYGGGGGWYGGAGSGNCRGGGGGSGYILPVAANPTMTQGITIGNGKVMITPIMPNSPTLTQTAGLPSGSTFPIGTTTNIFQANDPFGNTATCSFDVTVTDNEMPVISGCPSAIVMCPGNVVFNAPTATDNCSATVTQTAGPLSGDLLAAGTYPVSFLASDPTGNQSTCGFTITVNPNPTVMLDLGVNHFACLSNASFTLQGESPSGGTYSGNGVTGGVFDPSVAGAGTQTITYSYTDANGCSAMATDTIHVDVCTGISSNGIQTFHIYPNPASGYFWINTNENGILEIRSADGKLVKTEKITENKQEISLDNFAEGTYMVRFTTEKGIVSNGQLLIQK